MASYRYAARPSDGDAIAFDHGVLGVPDDPIIPYVEGDGTGPDIWRASVRVFGAAVKKAHGGERNVSWVSGKVVADTPALDRLLEFALDELPGATAVSTSSFGDEIIKGMSA